MRLGGPHDFGRRIAQGQFDLHLQSPLAQLPGNAFQVFAVAFHFGGFGQLELVIIARRPPVSDMHQEDLRMKTLGQVRDVRHHHAVKGAVLQGYEVQRVVANAPMG